MRYRLGRVLPLESSMFWQCLPVTSPHQLSSPALPVLLLVARTWSIFAGVATLFQTIGFGPIGARLPVMQGTSFAFVPIMIGIVKTSGMAALFGAVIVAGLFHTFLGSVIGRIRHWFPPLVTGIVITAIGLALLPVGIKYASGGAAAFQMNAPEWGDFSRWGLALVVIFVALGFKFFTRGTMSSAAILIGLIAGYVVGYLTGAVNFGGVAKAAWFAVPQPFKYGVEFSAFAIIGMCLMSLVSAIETVGDIFAKHVIQPECRIDLDDRCDEPFGCHAWCLVPCRLWSHSKGWCRCCGNANLGFGRRRDRDVWYGCKRWH